MKTLESDFGRSCERGMHAGTVFGFRWVSLKTSLFLNTVYSSLLSMTLLKSSGIGALRKEGLQSQLETP